MLSTTIRSSLLFALIASASVATAQNRYVQVNLVANTADYSARLIDPLLVNPWGVALRPPGAGGHWWTSNAGTGTTTTYVGDVFGIPIHQDELKVVKIPSSKVYAHLAETVSRPTGQVYNGSATDFWVKGEGREGPAKFIFCTLDGSVSGWTTDMTTAVNMIDDSALGSMYTGLAVTTHEKNNRLYVCNLGLERLDIFDHEFKPIIVSGDFLDPNVPTAYSHYNIQYIDGVLFVAWARVGDDPGEEDAYPGYGYLSEFDTEGNLLASYEHTLDQNAPWGIAVAPPNFGALSNAVLVANFGDGRILAYDRKTRKQIDFVRGVDGEPIMIDGIWGLTFGNGVTLGYTNHLYFAAGPNVEVDGIFGKLVPDWKPGDLTCDEKLDYEDIDGFVMAVTNEAQYSAAYPHCAWYLADVNADGKVNFDDIDPFIALLSK
jgi:uncharacterized protein (TIGR03118 family)